MAKLYAAEGLFGCHHWPVILAKGAVCCLCGRTVQAPQGKVLPFVLPNQRVSWEPPSEGDAA